MLDNDVRHVYLKSKVCRFHEYRRIVVHISFVREECNRSSDDWFKKLLHDNIKHGHSYVYLEAGDETKALISTGLSWPPFMNDDQPGAWTGTL